MKHHFKKLFYHEDDRDFIRSPYVTLIGVSLSVVLIYGVWSVTEHYFFTRAQKNFERHAHEHCDIVAHRIKQYESTLRSGVGFLQGSDNVTRDDWYRYVKAIDPRTSNPGIQGIGYAMMVLPSQLDAFEDAMRKDGYTSFELKPKGVRELYSSIVYLEPLDERNRAAIGYDMFSEPTRRDAMERARDTGKPALSGKVKLIQEIDKNVQAGVLIYQPYYADIEPQESVDKRRLSLLGYVYAPLRMGDFMNSFTSHRGVLNIELYDGERAGGKNLLYASTEASSYPSRYHAHHTLEIGGRTWHLYYSSTPAFDAYYNTNYPIIIALIGLILYLILLYIIVELVKNRSLLKRQSDQLQDEKEIAENYLDIVDVIIVIIDNDYKIRIINRRGCEMIGYSREEAIGQSFIDLFIPERIRDQMHAVANHIVMKNGYKCYENPIVTKSGEERLITWYNRPLMDEEGNVIGILSSGEDVTEIRHAYEQLQESEAFYRTLFGSIDQAIIILKENTVSDCNAIALELFDTTKEELIEHSIFDTRYEIECQEGSFQSYLSEGWKGKAVSKRCTLRLHSNPNVIKIIEFSLSRFGSDDENKLILVVRDITSKVEDEKMLTIHARQAQMGEMISMIAHQWRQPLAIINAITTQMRLKAMLMDADDGDFVDNLQKIEQQSAHLSQTISDYRDFFRPDKPKERFHLSSLIDHALNLIDHTLKNHSIHVETENAYDPILYTFRNELIQVLIVLLKNALDAFVENKIIGGEIIIRIRPDADTCILSITDNAGGIPSEIIYKLFSPYFTTKSEKFGTGLGLYMSRMIIEDHCGGTIGVSSQGNTTTFDIQLPCEEQ